MSKDFIKLIRDACVVEQEYRDLSSNHKMTPEAIIEGCMAYGGFGREKMAQLREALKEDTQRLRSTRSFIQQVYRGVVDGRYANGFPRDISRMAGMSARDEARQELGEINLNLWVAWAVAVEDAKKKHSEAFGNVKDPLAWQHKIDTLKQKRADLFKRISEEFGPNDIEVSDIREDGRAKVTMTCAPRVTLGPLHTLGERLISYLLSSDPETWTAASIPRGRAAWKSKEDVAVSL